MGQRKQTGSACPEAVFITARMGSTRLPGKHLLPVRGRPILEYLMDRVREADLPSCIVLCTTTLPEDDILQEMAEKKDILVFRGHPTDILRRWLDAARAFRVEFIISAEGDDVFCDPECIDRIIRRYRETGADYLTCRGLPFGATPTGVRVQALETVCRLKIDDDTEGQQRYFTETGLFSLDTIEIRDPELNRPEIRMTLDYPEDFQFFREVISALFHGKEPVSLRDIIKYHDKHPEIVQINQKMQKVYEKRFKKKYGKVRLGDQEGKEEV